MHTHTISPPPISRVRMAPLMLSLVLHVAVGIPPDRGTCLAVSPTPAQTATRIIINVDSWNTSRCSASAAQILLVERLGFRVSLAHPTGNASIYQRTAENQVDVAMEAWPAHQSSELTAWGSFDQSAHTMAGTAFIFEYQTLVTREAEPSQPELLHKLASPRLAGDESMADALAFVSAFQLVDADFSELLAYQSAYVSDAPDASLEDAAWLAACAWLKTHSNSWAGWITFPSRPPMRANILSEACFVASSCYDKRATTAAGWWFVFVQFVIGMTLCWSHVFRGKILACEVAVYTWVREYNRRRAERVARARKLAAEAVNATRTAEPNKHSKFHATATAVKASCDAARRARAARFAMRQLKTHRRLARLAPTESIADQVCGRGRDSTEAPRHIP